MELRNCFNHEAIIPNLKAKSKKQAMQALAVKASELVGHKDREILNALLQRENLGSTGIGKGVAIPHCKLDGLDHMVLVFARLDNAIDFEADDGIYVDLLFLLLASPSAGAEHLKALARIARMLRDPRVAEKLRTSTSKDAIYALLTGVSEATAA